MILEPSQEVELSGCESCCSGLWLARARSCEAQIISMSVAVQFLSFDG